MFSSVEVSISSRLHISKNMDHRNYQTSRMVSATINDFRDILPSWFLPTVCWKISYPRWVEREKSSKRTVFACSVFLVGLITPTSFKPLTQGRKFYLHFAHPRKDEVLIFQEVLDLIVKLPKTKQNWLEFPHNMLFLTYMFPFAWDWRLTAVPCS